MTGPLLRIEGLRVSLPDESPAGRSEVLSGVDLEIAAGEAVALLGPSGAGKSLVARAACGLLPPGAARSGRIRWCGQPVGTDADWRGLRGGGMTLILQEPLSALNPVLRVGDQIAESWRRHRGGSGAEARRGVIELLEEVRLPRAEQVARSWPHQLSGGMRQRALLAAALACRPRLLICDEPTAALDATVQAAILALLDRVRREREMALLFITHDPEVAALMTGRSVRIEQGRTSQAPPPRRATHPGPRTAPGESATPVVEAKDLRFRYDAGGAGKPVEALRTVDLALSPGRIVGLAGESGSGKSTLARLLCGHLELQGGRLLYPAGAGNGAGPLPRRARQMIFQDAGASLNPRQTVEAALCEAAGRRDRDPVALLDEVQLGPELLQRFPHELSGGQKLRVAVARALACEPVLLVADEIGSALDEETRGHVLGLLGRAVRERGLALLLIDHDLQALRARCDQVVVMYGGVVLEVLAGGPDGPVHHPYTRRLLAASPARLRADREGWQELASARAARAGTTPAGCPWAPYCELYKSYCDNGLPRFEQGGEGGVWRCPEVRP